MQEEITIYDVISTIKKHRKKINTKLILRVYDFAKKNHKEQKRLSGEAYIIHPLNVANILADINLDDATICAAILHDVVEDTEITKNDLEKEFGEEIAMMVDGVTKLRKTPIHNKRRTAGRKLQKNVPSNGKRHKSNTNKTSRQIAQYENTKIPKKRKTNSKR